MRDLLSLDAQQHQLRLQSVVEVLGDAEPLAIGGLHDADAGCEHLATALAQFGGQPGAVDRDGDDASGATHARLVDLGAAVILDRTHRASVDVDIDDPAVRMRRHARGFAVLVDQTVGRAQEHPERRIAERVRHGIGQRTRAVG